MIPELRNLPGRYKVVSFDLFDTLITRRFAFPNGVFKALEAECGNLAPGLRDFAAARAEAELELRRVGDFQREVTLEEIYQQLTLRLKLDRTISGRLLERELAIELEAIYPIPEMVALLDHVADSGRRVIVVSDTYFSREFIERILLKCNARLAPDRVYLSSENRLLKSSGTQFSWVLQRENLQPGELFHLGDNPHSDGAVPRSLGIGCRGFDGTAQSRYERKIAPGPEAGIAAQRLAGALRHARLAGRTLDQHHDTIRSVSSNVAGPLLTAFVAWCLEQARRNGYRRLYFVSRDGQVLLRMARRLAARTSNPIELRYLHGSRQAWHLPSLRRVEDGQDWIMAPTSCLTPAIVIHRLGLKPEDLAAPLREAGFGPETWTRQLDEHTRARLFSALCSSSGSEVILSAAAAAAELCHGYLTQEGLLRDPDWAIVDIGWNGRLQRSLSRILEQAGCASETNGLYLGLVNRFKHKPSDRLQALFGDELPLERLWTIGYPVPLLEIFVQADHGPVLGYRTSPNRYLPALKTPQNKVGAAWGLAVQQDVLEATAALMAETVGSSWSDFSAHLDTFLENFRELLQQPSLEEAKAYGAFPFMEDQSESYSMPLAVGFGPLEYLRYLRTGKGHHHNEWTQAALIQTSSWLQRCGACYRFASAVKKRLQSRRT
jgi:FMN phosphatase YigB (HAD superfamily)